MNQNLPPERACQVRACGLRWGDKCSFKETRCTPGDDALYLTLLTSSSNPADIVKDVYLGELRARVRVGERMLWLQSRLRERMRKLEAALGHVHPLQGLLPICSYRKRIRDDQDYWEQIESYFSSRVDVQFSHGVCPKCLDEVLGPELERMEIQRTGGSGKQKPDT